MTPATEAAADQRRTAAAPAGLERVEDALAALAAVLALTAVFFVCLEPIAATDFWWQARTGELILRTGRIPTRDPFSWTAAGQPWVVHEWLSEVLFYLAYTGLPNWTLLLYKSGMAVAACGLVLVRAWRRSGSVPLAAGAAVVAGYAISNYADLRPQMFTFVLVAGLLLALDAYREGRLQWLAWALPAVFALWANLHGGVVVGLILLALWTAGEAAGRLLFREPSEGVGRLALGLLLCSLAVGLNPNGYLVFLYPFQVLGHPEVMGYIREWWSPDFHNARMRAFELLLLGSFGALALRSRSPGSLRAGEVLVLLALAHAALLAQRNTAVFGLAAAPVLAEGLARLSREASAGWSVALSHRAVGSARVAATGAAVVLLAGLAVAKVPRVSPARWFEHAVSWNSFPHGAVARMKQGAWPGKLYNDYAWGGFLIWALRDRPVFIDGRAEVYYPTGAFEDEIKIHRTSPGWQEVLDRRGVEVVLTEQGGSLARALYTTPGWRLAYSGEVEAVYTRSAQRSTPGS